MAYRLFFCCEGRALGNASYDASLDDAAEFARAEMDARRADFFHIVDDAGTDVWHEGQWPGRPK